MSTILFGNVAPHEAAPSLTTGDPVVSRRLDPLVSHTTTLVFPQEMGIVKASEVAVRAWKAHSSEQPGWILAEDLTDEELVSALRASFNLPDITGPTMLLTNGGKDFVARQVAGVASNTAIAKYVGLSADVVAPDAADTVLAGEIATASGGLVRAAAVYSHTTGAGSYTLANTFTANPFDVLPVYIVKAGAFDAAASGNLIFESSMVSAPLADVGDTLPLTWTVSF